MALPLDVSTMTGDVCTGFSVNGNFYARETKLQSAIICNSSLQGRDSSHRAYRCDRKRQVYTTTQTPLAKVQLPGLLTYAASRDRAPVIHPAAFIMFISTGKRNILLLSFSFAHAYGIYTAWELA